MAASRSLSRLSDARRFAGEGHVQAARVHLLACEVELRSAALATATRSREGDVLAAQAWEVADAFSGAVSCARDPRQADIGHGALLRMKLEDEAARFTHAFNEYFGTARMLVEGPADPATFVSGEKPPPDADG